MKWLESEFNIEIDRVPRAEWCELLQRFDDASIYQTWSYGAVRWGKGNLSHLVLKKNGEVIAIAQSVIKKLPILRTGIAYVPWGPIWQNKGRGKVLENLRYILKAIREEYAERRGLLLRIVPNIVEFDSNEMRSILKEEGFQWISSALRYRTLLLNISSSLEDIRKRLEQKWRNRLNHAGTSGLKVIEGKSAKLYETFLALQREMLARKEYVPGVDYNEFGEIQKDLPDLLKMQILICEHKGKPVAAAIGSAIGDTGIYLLGATSDDGMKTKGSYLLQWRMIEWLKERGCCWYDLGGINPETNPGVYHFKRGLSGKDIYHVGQFEACDNLASSSLVKCSALFKKYSRKAVGAVDRTIKSFIKLRSSKDVRFT
jgi:lipid II:glycine glycyltransferase (peptidoglycan interpeptide bridge formation enzyme)